MIGKIEASKKRIEMATLVADGYSVAEAGKKVGFPPTSIYWHWKKAKSIIKKMEERAIENSQKTYIAKREEVLYHLTDLMRNSQDPQIRLKAMTHLVGSYDKILTLHARLGISESEEQTNTNCNVVIQLPPQTEDN